MQENLEYYVPQVFLQLKNVYYRGEWLERKQKKELGKVKEKKQKIVQTKK